ncbi:MAG: hypothetical protein NZ841_06180 [Dictyoglomus sp.]|nr:hypothetical protein [Dictyoglomus sp.]MDW8188865.1 hypothetical protein [Dictyoglomus sp.]
MAKEKQKKLSDEDILKILDLLEEYGENQWLIYWKKHLAVLDNDKIINDKEKTLRYLLLRVLINQQAQIDIVRALITELYKEFNDLLLFKPYVISELDIVKVFKKICGERGSKLYRVGFLGGIKPISLFTYRFKAYEGFIKWLEKNNITFKDFMINELINKSPRKLFDKLKKHEILSIGWVGNDPKACRMYINWILFLCKNIWNISQINLYDSFMIVDGHVGKIFCRTGLLDEVFYESKRPYIIEASKMRSKIENLVFIYKKIPFYVDNGAFFIYSNGYCLDIEPNCNNCILYIICKKYIKWTAYRRFI